MYAWWYIYENRRDANALGTLQALFPFEDDHLEQQQFSQLHKIVLGYDSSDLAQILVNDRASTDINKGDLLGTTPLMWAARRGDARTVQILLENNADPNVCNRFLQSPLLHAVRSSSSTCVDVLLEAGADPSHVDLRKSNALHWAVMHRADIGLVQRLIAAGTEVNRHDCLGVTPISHTALRDQYQLTSALLDNGAHLESVDDDGDSFLHQAILYQAEDVLRLGLERGACRTARNLQGRSFLHFAALYSDLKILEVLRSARLEGVEPDAFDLEGKTPLQLAQEREEVPENYLETMEKLLGEIRARNEMRSRASFRAFGPERAPLFDLMRAGQRAKVLRVCIRLNCWQIGKSILLYLLLAMGWVGFLYKLLGPAKDAR